MVKLMSFWRASIRCGLEVCYVPFLESVWQVKDALAAYLDRPELLKAVRVVYPVGDSGAFASYKDGFCLHVFCLQEKAKPRYRTTRRAAPKTAHWPLGARRVAIHPPSNLDMRSL